MPELAVTAESLGCNIVVWECDGKGLVPYKSSDSSGLFFVDPEAAFIHLVFKTRPGLPAVIDKSRAAGVTGDVTHHNHFEYMGYGSPIMDAIDDRLSSCMRQEFPEEEACARSTSNEIFDGASFRVPAGSRAPSAAVVGETSGGTCGTMVKNTGWPCRYRAVSGTAR